MGRGPVRTGVTAVLAHSGNLARIPVPAADLILNGNGELTGVGAVRRSGRLGAPILFTDTGSIGPVYEGCLDYMLQQDPGLFGLPARPEPVVGETWADFLHDTAGRHVLPEHALAAIQSAHSGPVAEGCVGGGTGMRAYSFKAGIGTASRLVPVTGADYTVGVLLQANHGRRSQLRIDGVPVGGEIPDQLPERGPGRPASPRELAADRDCHRRPASAPAAAPAVQASGPRHGADRRDFHPWKRGPHFLLLDRGGERPGTAFLSPVGALPGVVESTEEAILNSLTAATTTVGRDGNTIHALPLDRLAEVLREHGRLK